jgi:hypothetical protein
MLYRDSDKSDRQSILLDFFLWTVPASPFDPLVWYLAILLGGRETQIENFAAFIRREKRRVRQDLAGLAARGLVERLRIEPPLEFLCPSPFLLDPGAPPPRPRWIVPDGPPHTPAPSQGQMTVEDLYYATDQAYARFGKRRQRPECYASVPTFTENEAIAHYAKLAHVFVRLLHKSPVLADTWMHTTPRPPRLHQVSLPDAFSLDSTGKPNRAHLVADHHYGLAIGPIQQQSTARKIPCEVY